MRYAFYTADVFTDRLFGGNQLAVFPDAQGLTTEQMQQIANEFNLSETVFVLPPEDPRHTRRLRIFTPAAELPFAGHPTVGTAFILALTDGLNLNGSTTQIVFEEGVGPIKVAIEATDGRPTFAQLTAARLPEVGPAPPAPADLAAMLGLNVDDLLLGAYAPEAVSCGVPFLFIPLRSLEAVARARLRGDHWERLLATYWAPSVHIFAFGGEREGSDLHARMFAPALGVAEDPATGAAATALAGYLGTRDATTTGTLRWTLEQGFEMGRPSLIHIEADKEDGAITEIRVGGAAILVSEGTIRC